MSMPKILREMRDIRDEIITASSVALSGGELVLELPVPATTGSLVKFTAPCNYSSVTKGITIDGVKYGIVDTCCESVDHEAWAADSIVSILLNCDRKLAHVQTTAEKEISIDSNGVLYMT